MSNENNKNLCSSLSKEFGSDCSKLADCICYVCKLREEIFLYYEKSYQPGFAPYENEIVVHIVVPLLKALGWTPKNMGFEVCLLDHRRDAADIVLYKSPTRMSNEITGIVEVKSLNESDFRKYQLKEAIEQVKRYWNGRESVNFLVATDGDHYNVFVKDEDSKEFSDKPSARFQLTASCASDMAEGLYMMRNR